MPNSHTVDYIVNRITKTDNGCWLWSLKIRPDGYALCTYKRQSIYAHILSYKCFIGNIVDGLEVMHTCDVRHCVNPKHLKLGTHAQNMKDMALKHRGNFVRLTDEQIKDIRYLVNVMGIPTNEVANQYGISQPYVSRLARHLRRVHV